MNYLQRKKLAFMSIVNGVKGFVRTVLGVPPLTLPDCVDTDSVINYKIDGNSVQDGTPTPEAPVEVESVGEKTANLLSGINRAFSILSTYTIADNVLTITPTSKNAYQTYVSIKLGNLELGKTYTVSWNIDFNASSGAKPLTRVGYRGASNKWSDIKTRTAATSGRYNITFTLPEIMPEDMQSYGFCMLFNYTSVAATELVDYKIYDIMLVSGDTATDYEPFGYKIPVKCSGKNMFDKDAFCDYYNSFNHATRKAKANDNYLGEDCFSYYMIHPSSDVNEFIWLKGAFKENTQYVISGNFAMDFPGMDSRAGVLMFFKYTDSTTLTPTLTMYKDKFVQSKFVSDEGKTIDYIYIANFSATAKIYIKDFQIEEGTEATAYEPYVEPVTTNIYLDEPLRKIGSYADYIDFESGCVVRNTQKATLTSDKAYSYTTYGNGVRFNNVLQEGGDRYAGLCTHSKDVKLTSVAGGMWCGVNTTTSVYWIGIIDVLGLTTIDEFKEWLDTQSVEVICGKNTDVVEPITLPKLPTFKGTTIYSIDTAIQPSNMEVSYYSTSKE